MFVGVPCLAGVGRTMTMNCDHGHNNMAATADARAPKADGIEINNLP